MMITGRIPRMSKLDALLLAIIIGASATAVAAAQTITQTLAIAQKGRMFSTAAITIKKGDAVTFVNDDSVPHNAISVSPGNEFDLGSQRPGTSTDVTFTITGDADVICAIHPRMKMKVHITD